MFLGVPTVLWIVVVAFFSFFIFISFKISRWIAKTPIKTDSEILKRTEVLMTEKAQFNNFKQGGEVKDVLKQEGYADGDIDKALNDFAILKAKTSNPQLFTILIIILLSFDFVVKTLT